MASEKKTAIYCRTSLDKKLGTDNERKGARRRHLGVFVTTTALALLLALSLGACNTQSSTSTAISESSTAASESSEATSEPSAAIEDSSDEEAFSDLSAALAAEEVEPGGEPWLNTTWSSTVPDQKPEAVDDLYLNVAYDWLKKAKETGEAVTLLNEDANAIRTSLEKAVNDESVTCNGLDQLRIFYEQLLDMETIKEHGNESISPYIDAIMATKSLDELKALLVSDDFPFNPWISFGISFDDKRETSLVAIDPNMLFSNQYLTGGDPYIDWEDPDKAASAKQTITIPLLAVGYEVALLGFEREQAAEVLQAMIDLEKSYGKELASLSVDLASAYGEASKLVPACTIEELEKALPNFPIRELLTRYGKDKSEKFVVTHFKWAEPFNALWTDENFETLKVMTAVKVMNECANFLDPQVLEAMNMAQSLPAPSAEDWAYNACNQINTFSDVIAQNYTENTLGKDAVDRITNLSKDLIDTYKTLVNETTCFEDETRAKIVEKLDNMTLNILSPDSGYCDYSGLKLKTSEEGGTLISNYLAIKEYRNEKQNEQIGQPTTAHLAWDKIPPTEVNCFYNEADNSINIYPGYVTSANYFEGITDEQLYGFIGTTLGHEISHGFDYIGSQYDAYGKGNPIFVGDDAENFVELRDKLADYYSTISYDVEGNKVDGVNKSAEAAADLCGLQVVLEYVKPNEGFDYKTFFETYAMQWAVSYPPMFSSTLISDTHPLNYLRANVNAQMFDEFYETFNVKEGDNMYLAPEKRLTIWGGKAA